jgi:hypothetical protein
VKVKVKKNFFTNKKPKLSGAQRRKIARQKANGIEPKAKAAAPVISRALKGELLKPEAVTNRLETVIEWLRTHAKNYRRFRKNQITANEFNSLTYGCRTGADLAKLVEELSYLKALEEQLRNVGALHLGGTVDFLPAPPADIDHHI